MLRRLDLHRATNQERTKGSVRHVHGLTPTGPLRKLHLISRGVSPCTINATMTALRFFFRITVRRFDIANHIPLVPQPRRLPVILSPEEVARLLETARTPKYKAALAVAYGAGLRISEIVSLKVSDIDSKRMLIRVEQGKGRKDRYAMLSPHLLELLRNWWLVPRPKGYLFPGQDGINPLTTRHLRRICVAAARAAGITKRVSPHSLRHSFATHLLERKVDIRVIQTLLGHSKLDTTAIYTRVATKIIQEVTSPLEYLIPRPADIGDDAKVDKPAEEASPCRQTKPPRQTKRKTPAKPRKRTTARTQAKAKRRRKPPA
jgi:integrase/recombinase XerD